MHLSHWCVNSDSPSVSTTCPTFQMCKNGLILLLQQRKHRIALKPVELIFQEAAQLAFNTRLTRDVTFVEVIYSCFYHLYVKLAHFSHLIPALK